MGVQQDVILYMGQLESDNISIEGSIIDPDVHGLLDDLHGVICLPYHLWRSDVMTNAVGMAIGGENGP